MRNRASYAVITRALLARCVFVVHSLIAIWQMVEVSGKTSYWSLTVLALSIFLEGLLTIVMCEGQEAKWFCPSVFLYLCSIVPPVWYLQLDLTLGWSNASSASTGQNSFRSTTIASAHIWPQVTGMSRSLWIQILEQTVLVMLIIGRWILPKGDITREQLSQILLAYLAIGSDIVELFDMFKDSTISAAPHLPYVILTAWTLSLLQFPCVLTASKTRKMRVAITQSNSDEEVKRLQYMAKCEAKSRPKWVQILGDADVWAIVVALALQDVPFVLVRLYLMIKHRVMNYTMIFFTSKNLLVFMLQIYRLMVLVHERYHKAKIEQDAHRLLNHYRHMLNSCKDVLHKLKDESAQHMASINVRGGGKKKRGGGSGSGGGRSGKVAASAVGSNGKGGNNRKNLFNGGEPSRLVAEDDDEPAAGANNSNAHLIRKPYRRKRTSFQEEEEIIQIELDKSRDDLMNRDDEDIVFSVTDQAVIKATVADQQQQQQQQQQQEQRLQQKQQYDPNIIFSPSTVRKIHQQQQQQAEPAHSKNVDEAMRDGVDEFGSNTNTASFGDDLAECGEEPNTVDSQSTLNIDEQISSKKSL